MFFREKKKTIQLLYNKLRNFKYKLMSNNKITGKCKVKQPVLMMGKGTIKIYSNVSIGVLSSPYFLNGYGYFDARYSNSIISIDSGSRINNNSIFISDGARIYWEKCFNWI